MGLQTTENPLESQRLQWLRFSSAMTMSFVPNACAYLKLLILDFGVKCPTNANCVQLISGVV